MWNSHDCVFDLVSSHEMLLMHVFLWLDWLKASARLHTSFCFRLDRILYVALQFHNPCSLYRRRCYDADAVWNWCAGHCWDLLELDENVGRIKGLVLLLTCTAVKPVTVWLIPFCPLLLDENVHPSCREFMFIQLTHTHTHAQVCQDVLLCCEFQHHTFVSWGALIHEWDYCFRAHRWDTNSLTLKIKQPFYHWPPKMKRRWCFLLVCIHTCVLLPFWTFSGIKTILVKTDSLFGDQRPNMVLIWVWFRTNVWMEFSVRVRVRIQK